MVKQEGVLGQGRVGQGGAGRGKGTQARDRRAEQSTTKHMQLGVLNQSVPLYKIVLAN